MSSLLHTSTVGDRKEIRQMLSALDPLDRVRFLCECSLHVDAPNVAVSTRNMPLGMARRDDLADERVTRMVYADILMLANCYALDLDAAVNRLAGYASRPAGLRANPTVGRMLADALRVGRAVR